MNKLRAIKCANFRSKGGEKDTLCNGLVMFDINQSYAYCPKCKIFYAVHRDINNTLKLSKIDKSFFEIEWEPFIYY
jgi:hypothetical protein